MAGGLLDSFLNPGSDAKSMDLRYAPLLREMPEVTRKLGSVEALLRLRSEPVWLMSPYRVDVR